MKIIIPLIFSFLFFTFSNAQVGGWGNCEFATETALNAFDPSSSALECKKAFVQATNNHYHWDGTQWLVDPDSTINIYNTDDTLTSDRTVELDGNTLTFQGTNEVFIGSDGKVGINTTAPSEELEVDGDTEVTEHLYVGPNVSKSANTTLRVRENYSTDANTYQLYSNPTFTSPILTANRTSYGAYFQLTNNKTEDLVSPFHSNAVAGSFRSTNSGTNTFSALYGLQGYAYNNSTAVSDLGSLYGGYFQAYNNATSSTIGSAFGTYGYVRTINGKGGDITNAYGVYGRVRVDSDDGGDITTGRAGYFQTNRRDLANLMTTAYGVQIDVNDAVTAYGLRVDADDVDPTTNYGIYIDAVNATTNNYGIFGERGDWLLDHDGDGVAGGTGSGGDLVLGESQDLELYHDGTNSNIINNTGDLNITSSGTNDVHISTNGGNVGIGTTSPDAKLDVENGSVRFSDYGNGTNNGSETFLLGVNANGDVIELDTASYKSGNNIYNTSDALTSDRTLTLDGSDLTIKGTSDVFFQADGKVGIGNTAPTQDLDISGSRKFQLGTFAGSGGGKLRVDISDGETERQAIKTMILQTSGNNYAVNGTAAGTGATRNTGLYGWASGATTNFGLHVDSGYGIFDDKVGIGTTSPGAQLEVIYDRDPGFAPDSDDGQNTYLSSLVGINNDNSSWTRTITGLTPNVPDGSVSGLFTFGQGDAARQAGHMYFVDTGADGNEYIGFGIRSGYANILSLTGAGDVGIGTTSPDAKLDVEGGSVRFSDYGSGTYLDSLATVAADSAAYMLGVDSQGDVVEMNTAKSAKIFYPPALVIDASAEATNQTLDLQYVTLFGTPAISSSGAPPSIPTYSETELYYYITDYDTTVFTNVSISATGVLTYDIDSVPADNWAIFNVVFVVK